MVERTFARGDAAIAVARLDASRATAMLRDAIATYEALDAQLWLGKARAEAVATMAARDRPDLRYQPTAGPE